jgi:hypothetical protein
MTGELYFCCDERRRAALRAGAKAGSTLNGIDFLEVETVRDKVGNPVPGGEQRRLCIHFVNEPAQELIDSLSPIPPHRVVVEGGEQVRGIRVAGLKWDGDVLQVEVTPRGDFSTYTLRLGESDGRPLPGMDLLLSAVDFSFKVTCPQPGDCAPGCDCPLHTAEEPEIDYLAKDYASFRQLMLDRMALVLPGWRERSPADLGIVLVEMLAYVGDYLSYQQDAVATEAYLGTARRRTSVRRHARMLDYPMHDGCNARTWVQVELRTDLPETPFLLPRETEVLTRSTAAPPVIVPPELDARTAALGAGAQVFQTLHDVRLLAAHNQMRFWTWGQHECCLPHGAVRAALAGHYPALRAGDVLVLEEVVGPETGAPADADAAHRHAVRLTRVDAWDCLGVDPGSEWAKVVAPGLQMVLQDGARLPLSVGDVLYLAPPEGNPAGDQRTWTATDWRGVAGTLTAYAMDLERCAPRVDPVFRHLRIGVAAILESPEGDRPLVAGEVLEVLPPWDGTPAAGTEVTWRLRDANGREGTVTVEPALVELFNPPVTLIEWHRDDALPFPLCLSSLTSAERGSRLVRDVSVARGNVALADHGLTVIGEALGTPGEGNPFLAPAGGEGCGCDEEPAEAPAGRFRARLLEGPLTQATRVRRPPTAAPDEDWFFDPTGSATAARGSDPARALPVLWVTGEDETAPPWRARRDLLASGPFARDVVAEVDDDGIAQLRFGDDALGERPAAGVPLAARYRVGNGTAGNVGSDALAHLVSAVPGLGPRVVRVRNPLPATGGTDPESVERVKQVAPYAFRTPERAVTPADYARMAERHPQVQRAEATLRWTGSWRTVFLTVDRAGGQPVDAAFEAELRLHLERYRMAGHDLEIDGPRWVPLELEVFACVEPGYFRGDVERALREVLGSRALADGRRGFFHADNFTFGQSVYLSRLYAAVQDVAGLSRVEVRAFRRQNQPWTEKEAMDTGELKVGRLEIARLDGDPSHRDRGELRLTLQGGR